MALEPVVEQFDLPDIPESVNRSKLQEDMLEEWIQGTREAVRALEVDALRAERDGASEEILQRMRASLHNMKGEAGFMGLEALSDVCHRVETELADVKNLQDFSADVLLRVVDWLQHMVDYVDTGDLPSPPKASGATKKDSQKPRILIVEDGTVNRAVLNKMLQPISNCDVAIDGEAGLKAFEAALNAGQPFQVILLDIMMPKMDGQTMLERLRHIESERDILGSDGVKVIMTTALKDSKNVLGAFRLGCEGYLVKPIDKEKLFDKLRELSVIA